MAQGELTKAVFSALRTHLLARCPTLEDLYDNFPSPTQKLKYPSGSVFMGNPRFVPLAPWVLSKGDEITSGPDSGKFPVRRIVGNNELRLQIDLWSDNKAKRHALWKEFFNGFNNNVGVAMGVSLQLADYYGVWCHYSIEDYEFIDSEAESQRSEWRIRVSVLVDCYSVIEQNETLIETIENNLELPNDPIIPPSEDDDDMII